MSDYIQFDSEFNRSSVSFISIRLGATIIQRHDSDSDLRLQRPVLRGRRRHEPFAMSASSINAEHTTAHTTTFENALEYILFLPYDI